MSSRRGGLPAASWRSGLALIGLFCVLPTVVAIQLAGGTWAEVADFDGEVQLYQFTPDAEDGAAGAP